jgi:hypothetical protein
MRKALKGKLKKLLSDNKSLIRGIKKLLNLAYNQPFNEEELISFINISKYNGYIKNLLEWQPK